MRQIFLSLFLTQPDGVGGVVYRGRPQGDTYLRSWKRSTRTKVRNELNRLETRRLDFSVSLITQQKVQKQNNETPNKGFRERRLVVERGLVVSGTPELLQSPSFKGDS